MKVCSVDGCEKTHEARGMCRLHYDRARHNSELVSTWRPGKAGPIPKNRLCSEMGCTKPHKAKGLCKFHYTRTNEFKEHNKSKRIKRKDRCCVEGCQWIGVICKGMCQKHYQRTKKHGYPGAADDLRHNKTRPMCSVLGCSRPHIAHGLCELHYRRTPEYSARARLYKNRESSRALQRARDKTERRREADRLRMKRRVSALVDSVVVERLNRGSLIKLKSFQMPSALIEAKRAAILIRRLLKDKDHG